MISRRSQGEALLNSINFAGASACAWNFSTQIGVSTSTTSASARSLAIRGTEGSNPSTTESAANLTLSIRMPNISCRHQFAGRPCAEGAQPPWPGGGKEKAPRKESPSARVKHETAALRGGGDPNVNRSTRNCTARAALAGEKLDPPGRRARQRGLRRVRRAPAPRAADP
jgi:hypothetical protein